MSVTITISGNYEFCRAAGTIGEERFGCQTCEFDGRKADCRECGGKGYEVFERIPFEMNVGNDNFKLLWKVLGLEYDYSGSLDARTVQQALRGFDSALLCRPTTRSGGKISCEFINIGIGEEQAERYVTRLVPIVEEAIRREEPLVWG